MHARSRERSEQLGSHDLRAKAWQEDSIPHNQYGDHEPLQRRSARGYPNGRHDHRGAERCGRIVLSAWYRAATSRIPRIWRRARPEPTGRVFRLALQHDEPVAWW